MGERLNRCFQTEDLQVDEMVYYHCHYHYHCYYNHYCC